MTEDILFDNIYVGHSFDDAKALAAETYDIKKSIESTLSAKPDVDDSDYYIPSFLEDPVSHVRGKFAMFFDAAQEDPVFAITTYWDTTLVLTGAIFTLFGMLGVVFGLVGSQQKPVAKVSTTSTSLPVLNYVIARPRRRIPLLLMTNKSLIAHLSLLQEVKRRTIALSRNASNCAAMVEGDFLTSKETESRLCMPTATLRVLISS